MIPATRNYEYVNAVGYVERAHADQESVLARREL